VRKSINFYKFSPLLAAVVQYVFMNKFFLSVTGLRKIDIPIKIQTQL